MAEDPAHIVKYRVEDYRKQDVDLLISRLFQAKSGRDVHELGGLEDLPDCLWPVR